MSQRTKRTPPALSLVRGGAPDPESSSPPAVSEGGVMVIQNHALGDITRILLLQGDPHQPERERPAWASFEILPGGAPRTVVDELHDRVLEIMREVGEREWARERQVREWMRRGHLELLR